MFSEVLFILYVANMDSVIYWLMVIFVIKSE